MLEPGRAPEMKSSVGLACAWLGMTEKTTGQGGPHASPTLALLDRRWAYLFARKDCGTGRGERRQRGQAGGPGTPGPR